MADPPADPQAGPGAGELDQDGHAPAYAGEGADEDFAGPPPRHLVRARPKQRASWREDLVTGYCGAALALGLVVEGWAALNLPASGRLTRPLELLLAAGFAAAGLWLATRHQLRRAWSPAAVPPGYGLGLVGVAVALLALAGEGAWHALGGTGAGTAGMSATTGPFRLLLLLGTGLLATSGYRAAWAGPSPARGLGMRAFTPILLPLVAATTLGCVAFPYANPFVAWHRPGFGRFPAGTPEWTAVALSALFTVLAANLLLVAPVLLTLRRWQPPFGAVTVTFVAVGVLSSALTRMALVGVVGAALAGGLVADLVIQRWPPGPDHPGHLRLVAVATTLAWWPAYFLVMGAGYHQPWHPGLAVGALALATLSGYVLAVLMQPAALPGHAWDPADPADLADEVAGEELEGARGRG